jgi:hypothetical protein
MNQVRLVFNFGTSIVVQSFNMRQAVSTAPKMVAGDLKHRLVYCTTPLPNSDLSYRTIASSRYQRGPRPIHACIPKLVGFEVETSIPRAGDGGDTSGAAIRSDRKNEARMWEKDGGRASVGAWGMMGLVPASRGFRARGSVCKRLGEDYDGP